jgi:HK97 family phage prohead protease/HK97 family phage major capsid protein
MTNKTFYINSSFEAKSFRKGSKSLKIAGYANTVSKDRAGDVVTAEAWAKGIENFRKNPVMLYQHKHDTPIGRIEKITVDKKGIYVEGAVSEAAERTHGIQTLIKDGALKSFSVGFRVKDGKYNRNDDSMTITDVELLEISVVSVPCNQDSLFSIRKSFDSSEDYRSFLKSFDSEEVTTSEENTEDAMTNQEQEKAIEELKAEQNTDLVVEIIEDNETTNIDCEKTQEVAVEEKTTDTEEKSVVVTEEKAVVAEEKSESLQETTDEEKNEEEEFIARDPNESIPFINLLSAEVSSLTNNDLVRYEEKMYRVVEIPTAQSPIFKFLEIDANGKDCDNVLNVNVDEISQITKQTQQSEDQVSAKSLTEGLHNDSTKENDKMAEQVVDTLDLTTAKTEVETKGTVASVSEPRVADLVEKTGEAMLREADAKDKYGEYKSVAESSEVKELQSQISKYKDEIKALQNSKMLYAENSRKSSQYTDKEMANAVLLAKMLNKRDVFDTKYGSRMKAVTSVDQFLSNFSSNIYTEMEQQLVIAPMFNRIAVDAKTFRVPVADEDTDGDVAMFKSGSFATGIGDTTNVPTSNQNSIASVDFTPHKFMATTHLAKDEEEDTVLPLMDFLRAAATRRLARAIDKSILRGTGALTGFTASPTNSITAGTGYASVIEGITNLTADASLTVATGSSTDKVDPSDIASARAAMGKYGLQLGNDLVFITSIEGYNNLVTTSDFRTVDKFGPNATYLTGSVGAVYGIPLVISEFLDNVGSSGNHLGVLLYKPGFMIAERRGIEIESEYEPRQQVTAMYMSTRFDFKALTTNSSAALDSSKYAYATTIVAG